MLKSVRMRRSYSKKKMVAEESQRQYETQKTEEERKFVLEQLQRQLQARELEHKLKMEEVERREAEADNSLLREEQTLERQAKIEETKLRQVELSQKGSAKPVRDGGSKAPKLPRFDESKDNIDVYLMRFERYAKARGWPATEWAVYLSTLLSGKADEVYYALSEEQAGEYHELKKAILIRYELHEAGFRKKFKTAKPDVGESGAQFAHRLISYFQRWSELAGAENNVDSIKDLILRDQFLYSIPMEVAMFLRERQPKNMKSVITLTDQYLKAHSGRWSRDIQKDKSKRFDQTKHFSQRKDERSSSNPSRIGQANSNLREKGRKGPCFICGKMGHLAKDCRQGSTLSALLERSQGQNAVSSDNMASNSEPGECVDKVALLLITPERKDEMRGNTYKLECGHELTVLTAACQRKSVNHMPVVEGIVGGQRIEVLRDTGCSGVVIQKDLVRVDQLTGGNKTCVLIDGTVRKFPVARIHVDTPYLVGDVDALCMDKPVYPLILGNVPGAREAYQHDTGWKPGQVVQIEYAKTDHPPSNINKAISDDSNVSEWKDSGEQLMESEGMDLDITVIECRVNDEETTAGVETRAQRAAKSKPFKLLRVMEPLAEEVTPEQLHMEQLKDPTLVKVRELCKLKKVKECKNGGRCWYSEDRDIMYREFEAPNVDYGNKFHQVVVPQRFRRYVLRMAHESLLGGHQAAKRTSDRVLAEFWWPGIGADIKRYCQSCDICQRTIPKGRVTKVPLGEMPLMEAPFERVGVDLVGPIAPMTERGHRYILVMMDYATRYPEAVPLKNITAERVAEELLGMFTRLGIPKQILTDQGTQFMSGVMKEMSRLLSIKQLTTTPYHAMTNGLCERQNGVLKSTLRKMCEERPRDWDRYIGPILFAYRETPHTSSGFSPFELLFGRTVRGPMTILRELWTGRTEEAETKNTYEYVIDLQRRLEDTCKLARQELQKAGSKYRVQYNRKTKVRTLEEGDEVLLLLPTDQNKLVMQWKGPFKVIQKVNRMNYKVDLGARRQTFHINLLKKYFRRETAQKEDKQSPQGALDVVAVAVVEDEKDQDHEELHLSNEELLYLPPLTPKETVSDVNISENLSDIQKRDIARLLGNFNDVLIDIPGKTTLGEHKIRLTDTEPVRCKPYPIPHALRGEVEKEIDTMLKMGIIAPSQSPYACPLTMVVKKDDTYRCCCDTRKLNAKTEFDPEPVSDQEEIFAQLARDHFFTKIDLSKGYWQIPMEKESRKYTGFVTNQGHYEFIMMPFGLVNSAATFNKVMRVLFKGITTCTQLH